MAKDDKNNDAEDATEVPEDAEDVKVGEGDEKADGETANGDKKKGKLLKLLLFIGLPVVLLAVVAAVIFLTDFGRGLVGLKTSEGGENAAEEVVELPENITYYEMPELLVNIQSTSVKRKPYLRLAVKFEIHDPEAIKILDLLKPRIIDSFQVYLRELRVDDLEGSAGSQRLKEELLKRVNAVSSPAKVMDVLFQVFVVQ